MSAEEIAELLNEVLKRDVLEGDAAAKAQKQVNRAAAKVLRKSPKAVEPTPVPAT